MNSLQNTVSHIIIITRRKISMKLYEMTLAAQELYELLTDNEIDPEEREQIIMDTMSGMEAEDKLESYCKIIRQLEADKLCAEAEIERLTGAKKRIGAAIDRMKGAVLAYYNATGATRAIDAGTFRVGKKVTKAVGFTDRDALPKKYLRIKKTTEPDKTAIMDALKAGLKVRGAFIEERESINIK